MTWIEVKAYHVGTFGGVYPMDPAGDPTRWVNMDRVFSILFEEEKGGPIMAKLETERSGTFLVRDLYSIEVVRDYLQTERTRRLRQEDR
ncbi:MAG: hypothetical protein H8F28_10395 [Fibrella sp.]|nr:hypothetical protein [Armatimonadota bacterium]